MSNWKLSATAPKTTVQAALIAHDEAWDWDAEVTIAGHEAAPSTPDIWVLEAWYPRKPTAADKAVLAALFQGKAPAFTAEKLPNEDWLTLSQQGTDPIAVGPFYIHTPEHVPSKKRGIINFQIPASQAFGTGQHETTAGCLAMLTAMRKRGVVVRNLVDVGTGTGLLAFGAMKLWPSAYATASDIDEVCEDVVAYNAGVNAMPMGHRRGALAMVTADGMDHGVLHGRGPYDLLIANILAGPLIELAPSFSAATTDGGNLLLAGLLETQEAAVRRAYARAGFRCAARLVNGDWSILWLRKRRF